MPLELTEKIAGGINSAANNKILGCLGSPLGMAVLQALILTIFFVLTCDSEDRCLSTICNKLFKFFLISLAVLFVFDAFVKEQLKESCLTEATKTCRQMLTSPAAGFGGGIAPRATSVIAGQPIIGQGYYAQQPQMMQGGMQMHQPINMTAASVQQTMGGMPMPQMPMPQMQGGTNALSSM